MLYILATPIGNLADLSERAKETLRQTSLIIAENPGYSQRLTGYLNLPKKKFVQFAEHNETLMLPKLLKELAATDAVLLSDAGTPGISDPGFKLVRAAIENHIAVIPVPGPNAAITALCASGLPTNKFIFLGFVPKTETKLVTELGKCAALQATIIFYESPHRILKTVGYIAKKWPEARLVIARELTKLHEEFLRGRAIEILNILNTRQNIKGEITVLLSLKEY